MCRLVDAGRLPPCNAGRATAEGFHPRSEITTAAVRTIQTGAPVKIQDRGAGEVVSVCLSLLAGRQPRPAWIPWPR